MLSLLFGNNVVAFAVVADVAVAPCVAEATGYAHAMARHAISAPPQWRRAIVVSSNSKNNKNNNNAFNNNNNVESLTISATTLTFIN